MHNDNNNSIDESAKIGHNVKFWNFVYVGHDSSIGDETKIGSLVHIDYLVKIGCNCYIEGMTYIPAFTKIGNNVFIGPNCTITNDPYPPSHRLKRATIEDNAIIGAGASIKSGVTIGKNSVVAMGAVVINDVNEGIVVAGNPAKTIMTREKYNEKQNNWRSSSG